MNIETLKTLLSLNATVVSVEEAAKCALWLCGSEPIDEYSKEGKCENCGAVIFHDSRMLPGPKKICLDCALGQKSLSA